LLPCGVLLLVYQARCRTSRTEPHKDAEL